MLPPLHLIDQAGRSSHPTTLALIAARNEPAWLLGNDSLRQAAVRAGLTAEARLSVPTGSAAWGYFALRRALAQVDPSREMHAWSLGVLAALLRMGRSSSLVMHLMTPLSATELRQLRRLDRSTLHLVVAGESLRDRLIAWGFTAERIDVQPPLPLSEAAAKLMGQRGAIRQAWGVGESVPVVALLSDPPTAADAGPAMMGLHLAASAADDKLRLLVHPSQFGRPRAQTLLDKFGHAERFLQDGRLAWPWEVLRGCDAALLGAAPAPLSVRYALAAGLPIVAPDLACHREAMADAAMGQVHFALDAQPKRLADRLQHRALGLPTAGV